MSAVPQKHRQREDQLLSEWLATLPPAYQWKTHVRVGAVPLDYRGAPLTPAQQRAFEVWNKWCDVRIFTGREIWIVEAKIEAGAGAYGQAEDYAIRYPLSLDARNFPRVRATAIVLGAFTEPDTAARWAARGVRTITFTPSWAGETLATKIFPTGINA